MNLLRKFKYAIFLSFVLRYARSHQEKYVPSKTAYQIPSYYKFFPIFWLNPRPISNHQLNTLLYLHLGPIYLVVFKGSYCFHMRYPILRGASRLDAFSVYPVPT